MAADKYRFPPRGGRIRGVRTVCAQVKHTAATTTFWGAAIVGVLPPDAGG